MEAVHTQHSKGPVSAGDAPQLKPRAFQSTAELWLKMDESPLVHGKAACFHTLTPPAPCAYIQSSQTQGAFVPTVKLILIFFVSTKADGSICIQV